MNKKSLKTLIVLTPATGATAGILVFAILLVATYITGNLDNRTEANAPRQEPSRNDACEIDINRDHPAIDGYENFGQFQSNCPAVYRESSYSQRYRLSISHPASISILMSTEGLNAFNVNTYLILAGPVRYENDDTATNQWSSQIQAAMTPGDYTIEATTAGPGTVGFYQLTIQLSWHPTPTPPPTPTPTPTATPTITPTPTPTATPTITPTPTPTATPTPTPTTTPTPTPTATPTPTPTPTPVPFMPGKAELHTQDWQNRIYVHQTARLLLKVENPRGNPPVRAIVTVSMSDGLTIDQVGGDGWQDPENCRTGCTAEVRLRPDKVQDGENFILVKASQITEATEIITETEWWGEGNPVPQHTQESKTFSIERGNIEEGMHIQANRTKLMVGEETIITVHIQNAIDRPLMNAVIQINIPSGVDKASIDGAQSCTAVCRIQTAIAPGEEKYFTVRITPNETGEMQIDNSSYWIYEGEERRNYPTDEADKQVKLTVAERPAGERIPAVEQTVPLTPAAIPVQPTQNEAKTEQNGGGTLESIKEIIYALAVLGIVAIIAIIAGIVYKTRE